MVRCLVAGSVVMVYVPCILGLVYPISACSLWNLVLQRMHEFGLMISLYIDGGSCVFIAYIPASKYVFVIVLIVAFLAW